jgi:hypothetical protein
LPASLANARYAQRTFGADAEYSAGYWLVRGELIAARWDLPILGAPPISNPLTSTGAYVETRYRVLPGVTLAARVDHLAFNDQSGTYSTLPWDAPVTRIEGGVSWSVVRHMVLRFSLQHDTRTRGTVTSATLPAGQVTLWF